MKRNIISVALFAVLATMAVSCQKENLLEPQYAVAEIGSVRTVSYTVDGVTYQATFYSEAEWDAFADSMMTMAKQGHEIQFINQNASVQGISTKDTQTLTTTSQAEAKAWAKEKADQGYTVGTTYCNGQFTCVAVK